MIRTWIRLTSRRRDSEIGCAAPVAKVGGASRTSQLGVSQATISRMELGRGGSITLDAWATVASALGHQLVADLRAPRAFDASDDAARRCHALLTDVARSGGWTAVTEISEEQIESVLIRRDRREVAILRVWDSIASVGVPVHELRSAIARQREVRGPAVVVSGLVVVLRTTANRRRVTEGRDILREALPALGGDWIHALRHPRIAMPREPGLVWADRDGTRLKPTARRPGWR